MHKVFKRGLWLRAFGASVAILITVPLVSDAFAAPKRQATADSIKRRCVARYRFLKQSRERQKIARCILRAAKRQGSSSSEPLSGTQPGIPLSAVQAAGISNSLWLETAGVRQYRLIESTAEYPSGAPAPGACNYTDADKYLCQVPAPTGACANGSKVRGAVTDIRSDDPHDLVGWHACTLPSTATSTQSTCTLSKPAYTTSQFLNSNCATGVFWGHPDTGFTARGLLNRGDFYIPSIYYPRNLIPYNITHSDGETRVAGVFTYYHTALEAKGFGMTASRDSGSLQSTNLVIDDSVDNSDLRVCEKDVAAFAQRKESGVWKIFGFGDNNNPGDPGSGSPYRCDGTYVTGDVPPNWPNRKSGSAAPGSTMSFTPSSLTIDHNGVPTAVAINEAVSAPDAGTIVYNSYNPFNDTSAGTGAFLPRAFVVRTSPSQVVQLAPLDGTVESRDFSYAEAMAVSGALRYAAGWAGEWCYDTTGCNQRAHAVVWDAGTGGIENDLHPAGYQYSFARDISISSSGEIAVVVTGVNSWGNSRGATNEFLCGPGTGNTCETRDAFLWRKINGSWTSELLYRWSNGSCQGILCTGYNYTSDMTLREAFAVAHDASGALYIGGYGSASDTAGALCTATTSGRGEIRRACEYFGIRGLYAHLGKASAPTGTGQFQMSTSTTLASAYASNVIYGDFNNDARPDIAGSNSTGVGVYFGKPDGTFESVPAELPMGSSSSTTTITPANLVGIDLNGDNGDELLAARLKKVYAGCSGFPYCIPRYIFSYDAMRIAWESSSFMPHFFLLDPCYGGAIWMVADHLDNDPLRDLVITSSGGDVWILKGAGSGFSLSSHIKYVFLNSNCVPVIPPGVVPQNPMPIAPIVTELNGDQHPDIVIPLLMKKGFYIYFGSDGSLCSGSTPCFRSGRLVTSSDIRPKTVAAGDFDFDGHTDIAMSGTLDPERADVFVYRGDGAGNFSGTNRFEIPIVGVAPRGGVLSADDLNGDGIKDLLLTVNDPQNPSDLSLDKAEVTTILSNACTETYSQGNVITLDGRLSSAKLVDLNNDGVRDLLMGRENSSQGKHIQMVLGEVSNGPGCAGSQTQTPLTLLEAPDASGTSELFWLSGGH